MTLERRPDIAETSLVPPSDPKATELFTDSGHSHSSAFTPGSVLGGNYRLEKQLGRGGMGEAWKAFDTIAERHVVLKFVPQELQHIKEAMDSVKDSFKKVHSLQHQHICPVYDLFQDERHGLCLVMKFIDGLPLDEYKRKQLEKTGKIPFSDTVQILWSIAKGLDYAHGQKVIHRDIKPQNIMIGKQDGVQIIDFGLAEEIRTGMAKFSGITMDASGTRSYMAPEQWMGRYQDARTDQYALAVTAYELFAGRSPFQGSSAAQLRERVLNDQPESIAKLSEYVNAALLKGLAKKREDRFPDCKSFVKALATKPVSDTGASSGIVSKLPSDRPEGVAPPIWKPAPSTNPPSSPLGDPIVSWKICLGIVAGVIVLSGFFGFFLGKAFSPDPNSVIPFEVASSLDEASLTPEDEPSPEPRPVETVELSEELEFVEVSVPFEEPKPVEAPAVIEEPKPVSSYSFSHELTPEEIERLPKVRERLENIPQAKIKTELHVRGHFRLANNPVHGRFTPDGKRFVATGTGIRGCTVFDVEMGRPIKNLTDDADEPLNLTGTKPQGKCLDMYDRKLATHPDGKIVAVAKNVARTQNIVLWDLETGEILREIQAHKKGMRILQFGPDGSWLASKANGEPIVFWNTDTGEEIRRFDDLKDHSSMVLSSVDEIMAVSGDGKCSLWDVRSNRELSQLSGRGLYRVAFNRQGTVLAFDVNEKTEDDSVRKIIVIWDLKTGRTLQRIVGIEDIISAIDLSPDGSQLAVGFLGCYLSTVWDVETGLPLYRIPIYDRYNVTMMPVFSNDGTMLAMCADGTIVIWDVPTGEELARWENELKEKRETVTEIPLEEWYPPELSRSTNTLPHWNWGIFTPRKTPFKNSLYTDRMNFSFRLNKQWKTFRTQYQRVHLWSDRDKEIPYVFIVKGDGKELFRSRNVLDHDIRPLKVNVQDVDRLELIIDSGNEKKPGEGFWFTPMLLR